MKNHLVHLVILLLAGGWTLLPAQSSLEVETGLLFTGYNNVRIPGDQGTLFSLNKDLQASEGIFSRVRFRHVFNQKHGITLLYAPLRVDSDGSVPFDIRFQDKIFEAMKPLEAVYIFNSYRLTYHYRIRQRERSSLDIGLTAKIRDAEIRLQGQGLTASKKNTGFVPIVYFRYQVALDHNFGLLLEGDALAAPQGRAEDVMLAITRSLGQRWRLSLGYRLLEGGADNDEVYTFSLFHYAVIGLSFSTLAH